MTKNTQAGPATQGKQQVVVSMTDEDKGVMISAYDTTQPGNQGEMIDEMTLSGNEDHIDLLREAQKQYEVMNESDWMM